MTNSILMYSRSFQYKQDNLSYNIRKIKLLIIFFISLSDSVQIHAQDTFGLNEKSNMKGLIFC